MFLRFLEETAWKNHFDFVWPLGALQGTRILKKYIFSQNCAYVIYEWPPSPIACRHLFGWQICKNWEHNYTGILSSYQSYQSRFGNWGFCLITYQTHWCVFTRFCPAKRSLKFMFSKKATKIDKIFTVDLTLWSKCQIHSEEFVKFCGLLIKHRI